MKILIKDSKFQNIECDFYINSAIGYTSDSAH